MSAWGETKPPANPQGSALGADDIQIKRDDVIHHVTEGAISESWRRVKAKSADTLLLSFLFWFVYSIDRLCQPSDYTPSRDSAESEFQDTDTHLMSYDFFQIEAGGFAKGFREGFRESLVDPFVGMTPYDWGVYSVELTFGLVFTTLFWAIRIYLRGGTYLQTPTLGKCHDVRTTFLKLLGADFLFNWCIVWLPICLAVGLLLLMGSLGDAIFIPATLLCVSSMLVWIVFADCAFGFYDQLVIDKNLGPVEALKASFQLTRGHRLELLFLYILLSLMHVGGMILFGVGLVVTLAVAQGTWALVYERLAEPGNAYLHTNENLDAVFE